MTSSLLLGACSICGELIVRHRRPDGRQITCAELARIDQQFRESGPQPTVQPIRKLEIVARHGDRDGEVGVSHG